MTPPMLRPLGAGEILDTSFSLYRRHFGALATVALVCTGAPLVVQLFAQTAGGMWSNLPLLVLYLVIAVVLNLVATAATVFIVSESYLGRPITARDALRRATPYIGRILASFLLMALAMALGILVLLIPGVVLGLRSALAAMLAFLLLLVPGIILIVGLAVTIPAVVLEPGLSPGAALGRSWQLTRGARWRILGLGITLLVLLYVPFAAVTGLFAMFLPQAAGGSFGPVALATIAGLAIGGLVQIFIYPLFYCVLTVTYYDLRVRKEGFDLELLASTLQSA